MKVSGANRLRTSLYEPYQRYWGKTDRLQADTTTFHLLCFHCLDVAACGRALLDSGRFSLEPLAVALEWDLGTLEDVFLLFLTLHDAGKFARAFQGLAENLSSQLVPKDPSKLYWQRHDTLGLLALIELHFTNRLGLTGSSDWWKTLFRIVAGHHGRPPREQHLGQPLRVDDYFSPDDLAAVGDFAVALADLLITKPWPVPEKRHVAILRRYSFQLAGLCVLADWIGSDSEVFPFRAHPMPLAEYWKEVLPKAIAAVSASGLEAPPIRPWSNPSALLPAIMTLTPLQQYAASVTLWDGPQMFLLEDVTGAGKTEAALLLSHRLLAAGRSSGVYFALPTMATANQMYARVGEVYRRFFTDDAQPSLVLAHSARLLIDSFRDSILPTKLHDPSESYEKKEPTGRAQCATWLADSRKKSMLADIGVGTIDQALQAVLPERHQSLRLLGLCGKVLVVDEVHACDTYTGTLLLKLLEAHAQAGGSAILLSATVPGALRTAMVSAFRAGSATPFAETLQPDARYPLATHVIQGEPTRIHACTTRPEVARSIRVNFINSEEHAIERIVELASLGRCICWVRNTVHDARHGYNLLRERLDASKIRLFHSRFAMGDRLERECTVVETFGERSGAIQRRGQVLVATQVVEQSLDLDFDEMVTDLAPIDLVIQRAGRLRRHLRENSGKRILTGPDGRGEPTLHILAPVFVDSPPNDWYSSDFPKAAKVYEDTGGLWRTMGALLKSGTIISPGAPDDGGGVRRLVEAVYGDEALPLPDGLQTAERKVSGKALGNRSQAGFNTLKFAPGYCEEAGEWEHTGQTPTRLGDETDTVYLAREGPDRSLEPFLDDSRFPWEMSAVRVRKQGWKLSEAWSTRFAPGLQDLRRQTPLLADQEAFILPLVREGDNWRAEMEAKGSMVAVKYSEEHGLSWEDSL